MFRHCKPLIIQDYCSWPYDKTYDTQSFVGQGNMTTLGWKCHTQAELSCDIFNLGSSNFHVPLTFVRHLLNAVKKWHDKFFYLSGEYTGSEQIKEN